MREGRVANVALSRELRGAVPDLRDSQRLSIYTTRRFIAETTGSEPLDMSAAIDVAVDAAIRDGQRGPWRMWTANGGPLHIKDPRR